jgi:SET domain-containing protein
MENRQVKILVASRDISEGEEITFSYQAGKKTDERKRILRVTYGFVCQCPPCTTNPEIEAMLM